MVFIVKVEKVFLHGSSVLHNLDELSDISFNMTMITIDCVECNFFSLLRIKIFSNTCFIAIICVTVQWRSLLQSTEQDLRLAGSGARLL